MTDLYFVLLILCRYYYWFAFPAFIAKPAWDIGDNGWVEAEKVMGVTAVGWCLRIESLVFTCIQLASIHAALQEKSPLLPYFLARPSTNTSYEIAPVSEYATFFANVSEDSVRVYMVKAAPSGSCRGTAYRVFHRPFRSCPEPWLAPTQPPCIPSFSSPLLHTYASHLELARR